MPKGASRAVVAREQASAGNQQALTTSYCAFCQEFVLVSDTSLSVLPQRPVDHAIILRNRDVGDKKRVVYKLNARVDKRPIVVRRPEGKLERVYRSRCTRCDLQVGYEVSDPQLIRERGERMRYDYSYILDGALTEQQGVLPPSAFDERVGWHAEHDARDQKQEAEEAQATVAAS